MSISAKLSLKSVAKTEANLNAMVDRVSRQSATVSVRKACQPMKDRAKELVRKKSGLLEKSLIVKIKSYKSEKLVVGYIGPNRAVKGDKGDWPVRYAHLIELGHAGPRPAKAYPYLRPAFDQTKDQSLKIYADDIKDTIIKTAQKFNDKNPF